MAMKFLINILLLLIFLLTVSHGAEEGSRKSRLKKEDIELDKQLNILNKPPITSFKIKDGEIIDCVDIYKQPAFDHPLLKNHKLQRRPSFIPEEKRVKRASSRLNRRQYNQGEFKGCSHGTVPFRRVQKEDLINAKAIRDLRRPRSINSTLGLTPEMHYAALTTPDDKSRKIEGASTFITVYNLSVQAPQLSEALLWIGSGVSGSYSSVEYGWTVNPQLYGDSQSRTYSQWTADGFENTGCYNSLCPGYVQISPRLPMGSTSNPVSTYGGKSYGMDIKIYRDQKTSNWWIIENFSDLENEPIGYWPKELFPTLADSTTVLQLGGKVYSPSNIPKPVPMGSGVYAAHDLTRSCYASKLAYMDTDGEFYLPTKLPIQVTADNPDVYKADYLGKIDDDNGYTLLFGGPDHIGWNFMYDQELNLSSLLPS